MQLNNYDSYKNGRCTDLQFLKYQFVGEQNPGKVTKYNIFPKKSGRKYFLYVISRYNLTDYYGDSYDEFKIIDLGAGTNCLYKTKIFSEDKNHISNAEFWKEAVKYTVVGEKIRYYYDTIA